MGTLDDAGCGDVTLSIDGRRIVAKAGDTIAGAMLAAALPLSWRDGRGARRGVFCNMGICCECLVTLSDGRRTRACLTVVADGLEVTTGG